jgi:LPXTG-motif cell wall-anchored protein
MRRLLKIVIFGGAVGGSLATWIGPKWISWYFTPPVEFGVSCTAPVEWALARFQWVQFYGIVGGVALTLALYFIFRKKRNVDFS